MPRFLQLLQPVMVNRGLTEAVYKTALVNQLTVADDIKKPPKYTLTVTVALCRPPWLTD